jgi:glycosyltransferase involved in cell wall biosynthesis
VTPNGVDPTSLALPEPGRFRRAHPETADRLIYLFLGRLDANKGLDLLLPAFARLAVQRANVHLVLAGPDELGYEARVREMIRQLRLGEHVTCTGLLGGEDKLAALRDADVFVLPSRYEGLSVAMLEAMFAGLPVIVTNRVGLCREVASTRCGIVVPLDESALAEALEQVAATPERAEMGHRGRELVSSKYTWGIIARNLAKQIEESIGCQHPGA